MRKEKIIAPKLDRFAELLEKKQDVPAFPEPEKVQLQNHQIVCFAPSRSTNADVKNIPYRCSKDVYQMLENHTSGSKSIVIDKLIAYAIEELQKRNISIK